MKSISRRIRRLEERFGPPVETEFTRRLRERIEAGRRRVSQWREQVGISVSDQHRENVAGLSETEILNRGRAKAREHHPRQRLRLVVSGMDRDLALETSTCQRTLTATGCLIEVVRLDGRRDGLTHEELEKFVKNFPVRDHSMKEP